MAVFINELHYDNSTANDPGEFIEVAATAGTDLTGWTIVLYNGNVPSAAVTYGSVIALNGVVADPDGDGFGYFTFTFPAVNGGGFQNGGANGTTTNPDGLALVRPDGSVAQLLSYEGVFTASNGPAAGMTSTDIGVFETNATAPGSSLALRGTGTDYSSFTWGVTTAATPGGANTGQAFGFAPSVSVSDATVVEGNAGTTVLAFTVTRSGATGVAFTVDYGTAPGTATSGTDYLDTSGTLSFAAGETTKTINVTVRGDTLVEPNETVQLTLGNATNGVTVNDGLGIGMIVNDDAAATGPFINEFHYDNSATNDPGEFIEVAARVGTDLTGWTIVLYNGTNAPTAAPTYGTTIQLSGIVADPDGDGFGFAVYNFPSVSGGGFQNGAFDGLALVRPDQSVAQFLSYEGVITAGAGPAAGLTSTDVGVSETNATAPGSSLGLTGNGSDPAAFTWAATTTATPGAVNTGQSFTAPVPRLSVNDVTVIEGDSGTVTATFTVTRSGAADAFTVSYATADGTATAGSDYVATSGTLSFAVGETSKQVSVLVNGDTVAEGNETFFLNLTNPTNGATLADGQGLGTITNDDAVPSVVSIGDVSVTEGNSGETLASFVVTRTGGSGAFTVDYGTASNTAVAGQDFVGQSGTLTFAAGETSKTIQVAVLGDTVVEPNENFFVTLSNAQGASIGDGLGQGTIVNDDFALTKISAVQGNAFYSPILASEGVFAFNTASSTQVTVQAVVTALDGNGARQGFYLMEEEGDWDADTRTSEGIFVMTRNDANVGQTLAAFAPTLQVGQTVTITANVMEYQSFDNLPRTMLVNSTIVGQSTGTTTLPTWVLDGSEGRRIPNAILTDEVPNHFDAQDDANDTFDPASDALDFFETIEGMRVTVPDMVVGDGFASGADATVRFKAYSTVHADADQINSRGGYTIAGNTGDPEERTNAGGRYLHDGDTNPDIIELDFAEAGRGGTAGFDQLLTMGDRLGNVTGILDFDFENVKLYVTDPIDTSQLGASPVQETLTLAEDTRSLRVATFNVENLDPTDDANNDEADINGTGKFNDLARAIAKNLKAPDIISIEEIQDNNGAAAGDGISSTGTDASITWTKLVTALNAQTGLNYQWVDKAPVYNAEGGEQSGNIRVGFLYNTDRVQLGDLAANATLAERRQYVDRIGDGVRDAGAKIAFDDSQIASEINAADWSNTRKSLLGEFTFNGNTVYVTANHLPSKGGSEAAYQFGQDLPNGQPANGGWDKRVAIANDLYTMFDRIGTANPAARIVAGGDFNDFYFYRPLEVLTGAVNTDGSARTGGIRLDNLTVTELPEAERYTYAFDGRSQAIDHILVDKTLSGVASYDIVHINTGYNERTGAVNPALSDHDPAVAQFDFRTLAERLVGDNGANLIEGFGGNDTLIGGAGADTLVGGQGDDRLDGGADGDLAVFIGLRGDYGVSRNAAGEVVVTDSVTGRDGQDTLAGIEQVRFGDGSVVAIDQLFVGVTRTGTSAGETLTGTAVNDTLRGLGGADVLNGLDGDDIAQGGQGNDTLNGGLGNDKLHGGAGDDSVFGGEGADYLVGGLGNDQLSGGAGADIFFFGRAEGRDTVVDYTPGQDVVHLLTGIAVTATSVGDFDGNGASDVRLTLTGGGQVTFLGVGSASQLTILTNQTAQIADFG